MAAQGTVIDPDVVRRLRTRRRLRTTLERLTPGNGDVLAHMAEGRSNTAISRRLAISDTAVAEHVNGILAKLDLPPAPDDHRRVLAVLTYLRA